MSCFYCVMWTLFVFTWWFKSFVMLCCLIVIYANVILAHTFKNDFDCECEFFFSLICACVCSLQIKREISTMKLIRHPNVIRMHEVRRQWNKLLLLLKHCSLIVFWFAFLVLFSYFLHLDDPQFFFSLYFFLIRLFPYLSLN